MDTERTRTALVTGAGSGIGRAIALALASAGYRLLLTGRRREPLMATAADIEDAGGLASIYCADLMRRDAVDDLAGWVGSAPLDVLVLNAALGGPSPLADLTTVAWTDRIEVDLVAPMRLTRALLPQITRGGGGRIIGIASVVARFGVPNFHAYCASKAGIVGFCRALARDVAKDKITVNAICPGWVRTAMADEGFARLGAMLGSDAAGGEQAAMGDVPIGRVLNPAEIASLVVYLCTEGAAGMTGQALTFDGGVMA